MKSSSRQEKYRDFDGADGPTRPDLTVSQRQRHPWAGMPDPLTVFLFCVLDCRGGGLTWILYLTCLMVPFD